MGSDIDDNLHPVSLQELCGGSHQSKIEIACHATSSPEANKDETSAQEPPGTPVAPPRHPKTDIEVLQLHPILCSIDMDSIEQPIDSFERFEVQMLPCGAATVDAIVDAETSIISQLDTSFDQDTSLDTIAFELDSFFCSTPLDPQEVEITFDAPLMHTTIPWQLSKLDVTSDHMSVQPAPDVASMQLFCDHNFQCEQGQLKEQYSDPMEDEKEPCHMASSEAIAIVMQPRPPPSPNPSTGHHAMSESPLLTQISNKASHGDINVTAAATD